MTECNKSVYLANKSIDMIDAVNKGYADGYNKAIDDMVGNLIANSRTEIIDGKLTLIVTEERIKTVANEMKRMECD